MKTEPTKRKMSTYDAVALAEGFEEGTEEEQIEAWQYLLDTGIVWQLQGMFGRQAMAMVDAGVIKMPAKYVN